MPFGYHNKVLRVDLGTSQVTQESPGDNFYRTYLGGWGLIAHYLLREVPRGIDALSPQNLLIFAPGIATGVPVGGSGRHAVGAKSPLTGGFGESDVGGFWGAEFRHAGWDALIISGAADHPVYLWIQDDRVEIRDAAHLWGKTTADVEERLRRDLGDDHVRVAQCGLAGEKLSRIACVIHDINRAAGRTGLGAVMGSKKLKAVAVRGTGRVDVTDAGGLQKLAKWLAQEGMTGWTADLRENGTNGGLAGLNATGGLPTRNFQQGAFEGASRIAGDTMTQTILVGRDNCFACPVHCKRRVQCTGRYAVSPTYGGPEYETIGSLGSCCGIDDLEAIAFGNQLCNAYGLDTISTGVSIAWAMECFERGLLTPQDTDGLELRFGNAEAMLALVERIAHRQGLGDLLAEGSLRAARAIGRGTERYAVQVKGQELPMHEPRLKFGLGLGYTTSPTGADHMHNIHDTSYAGEGSSIADMRSLGILDPIAADDLGPEKVRLVKYGVDWQVMGNCLGLCAFMPYTMQQVCDLVRAVTGWNSSIFELMKTGERALAMARAYNYREGLRPSDDAAHWRFATPFESGPTEGVRVPEQTMRQAIDWYYGMNSWDLETGVSTEGKLHELGLGWLVELMKKEP